MKIIVIGGLPISLINFRRPLLREMVSAGHSVTASANGHDITTERKLEEIGVQYHPIRLERAGLNPVTDLLTLIDLIRLIHRIHPDIILTYTIKPIIYGGLAAAWIGVHSTYSMIEGLGYAFIESTSPKQRLISAIARTLYRYSLRKSNQVFFLNPDDMSLFLKMNIVHKEQVLRINGTGVDLDYYAYTNLPKEPVFLMIARLLADKGVREYAITAARVKQRVPEARFLLVGDLDPNPSSIKPDELKSWQQSGVIKYLGYLDDVRPAIRQCRYYVLPSYREGVPRTVLEAMSMGRPILTTDAPGCRETMVLTAEGQKQRESGERVMCGENGFLVRPRDVEALEKAMLNFLKKPELAESIAKRSREIAEEKFDVHKVNSVIMKTMGLY